MPPPDFYLTWQKLQKGWKWYSKKRLVFISLYALSYKKTAQNFLKYISEGSIIFFPLNNTKLTGKKNTRLKYLLQEAELSVYLWISDLSVLQPEAWTGKVCIKNSESHSFCSCSRDPRDEACLTLYSLTPPMPKPSVLEGVTSSRSLEFQ